MKTLLIFLLSLSVAQAQKAKTPKVQDAKNKRIEAAPPKKDPELAKYYINLKTSPRAQPTTPVKTTLPLKLEEGARIALIGNLLLDAERRFGHLETHLHQLHPNHKLTVRNLAWPADEIDLMPRPDNFGDLDQHLTYFKPDIIIAAYGYNESFAGKEGLPDFKQRLDKFLSHLKSHAYNGKNAPQIVLLSPASSENQDVKLNPTSTLKAASLNNPRLELYAQAISDAAATHGLAYIDILEATNWHLWGTGGNFTIDGHQFNESGHSIFANRTVKNLFDISFEEIPKIDENLRSLVVDKATQFFYRYRPLNTFYYTGARNKSYGYLDFLPAMRNFDLMVENRDKAIHTTVSTGKLTQPDDSNLPKMDDVLLSRGANKFLSPDDELKAFKVDPRFEVNCFASEEDFPEMACPIQMRWDTRGRLWVSTSVTYPHVYPGQKPCDKIIILEDTDEDGKADKCTTWADDLHIPLSFVLDGSGGVYCSEEPHFTHLTDRDGDGKMDHREILFTGFGCEDSHHALHDFTWTPGGDLLFRESIFHNTQVETAYGPVRARNSSWFLFHPSTKKLTAFGSYPNTNPWGVTFDPWGNHVASHPVFASTFHATNPTYPRTHKPGNGYKQESGQHPHAKGMQAYSGVCGHDFVSHDFWPKEMQGGFIKARYKPTNKIEFHKWVEKEDHFAEEFQFDLIFSTNLSFIPVDLNFGPRGACYVCDWYNPVKGHAQYSLRDPRRDRKAGRIWRIIPKGAQLAKPPMVSCDRIPNESGSPIPRILDHLKSPHYRTRYRAKLELRGLALNDPGRYTGYGSGQRTTGFRGYQDTVNGLTQWTKKQTNPLHLLEALWLHQDLDYPNLDLLEKLIKCDDHLVAASAFGPLRFWGDALPANNVQALLSYGASHPSQHVRREAALCASYIGGEEALKAIAPILDLPAGTHLAYAIRSSFNSENLKPHWLPGTEEKLKGLAKPIVEAKTKLTKEQKKFDRLKNLATIKIGTIPERLLYTRDKFTVEAGQPVKLIFSNPDATEHNLLILDKGTPIQEVGEKANLMAADPEAAKKHYIPDDKRILHATKMLKVGKTETLRFKAPTSPGIYPFICTFPGHWTIMKGEMIVK